MSSDAQRDQTVRVVDPIADQRWDTYVDGHPGSGVYHLGAWAEVMRRTYGYRPRYLALESGGRLAGVLPAFLTRGAIAGKRLRALPLLPVADPIADDAAGQEELLRGACRLAADEGARLFTLHARDDSYAERMPELRRAPRDPTWILRLPPSPDELRPMWKKHSRNLHRSIGKADAAGITVREGRGEGDLKAFYGLYLRNMRRLHAVPKAYRQVALSAKLLEPRGSFKLFVAEYDDRVVAAITAYRVRDYCELLFIGTDENYLDVRPNHAVYRRAIEWAAEEGMALVDLGGAPAEHSLGKFKAQWAAEEVPEYRYDHVVPSAGEGAEGSRADSVRGATEGLGGRRPLVVAAWNRMPLAATRLAGLVAYRYA